jgi:hypothetical protein
VQTVAIAARSLMSGFRPRNAPMWPALESSVRLSILPHAAPALQHSPPR